MQDKTVVRGEINKIKLLKGICFLGGFLVLFCLCQQIFQAKWLLGGNDNTASTSCWTEYERLQKDTVDVLFLGTSHVLYAMDPMYMYGQTGMTSYVFSGPGLRMDLSALVLEDALKTQHPKAVFLDASGMHYTRQQTEAKAHKIADLLPLSPGKLEYAFGNGNDELDPLGVLFPFFRYHSRWTDLNSNDFKAVTGNLEETSVRGHYISYDQVPASLAFYEPGDFEITAENLKYLDRMADLCRKEGIQLILYKIPTPQWNIAYSDAVACAAEERGLEYWEMYYELEDIGIDPAVDFNDDTDHVNQYGAEKLSAYTASYIMKVLGISDHRGSYTDWDNAYQEYVRYKAEVKQSFLEKSE